MTSEILSPSAHTVLFNWVDWLVVAMMALSMVVSFWRGFVKEAISLAAWVLAFFLAFHFMAVVALWGKPWITNDALRTAVSFGVIFFGVLLAGGVLNYVVSSVVASTGLSVMDRLLGLGFGFLRGALVVVIIAMIAQALSLDESDAWRHSSLLPAFVRVTQWIHPLIPLTE